MKKLEFSPPSGYYFLTVELSPENAGRAGSRISVAALLCPGKETGMSS